MRRILMCFSVLAFTVPAMAQPYELTEVNYPGDQYTSIFGLDDHGGFVGNYAAPDDPTFSHVWGFVSDGEHFEQVDIEGSPFITVDGINNRGVAVGWFADPGYACWHGFIRHPDGEIEVLPDPAPCTPFYYSGAMDINESGTIVGRYFDRTAGVSARGFVYRNGKLTTHHVPGARHTDFGGINDHGQIAGSALFQENGAFVGRLFILDGDAYQLVDFPAGVFGAVYDINNRGEVVGELYYADGPRGFVYRNGTFTLIDYPGALNTGVFANNDRGDIAGTFDWFSWGFVGRRTGGR